VHLRRALGAADRAPGGALGAAGTADVGHGSGAGRCAGGRTKVTWGILDDFMGFYGILWDFMGFCGIFMDVMGLF